MKVKKIFKGSQTAFGDLFLWYKAFFQSRKHFCVTNQSFSEAIKPTLQGINFSCRMPQRRQRKSTITEGKIAIPKACGVSVNFKMELIMGIMVWKMSMGNLFHIRIGSVCLPISSANLACPMQMQHSKVPLIYENADKMKRGYLAYSSVRTLTFPFCREKNRPSRSNRMDKSKKVFRIVALPEKKICGKKYF